jgi:hypothetical protein
MGTVVTSFFWIVGCAVLAPLVAGLIPGKRIPEVVLLLVGGILIGPHALDWAVEGSEIEMLRELGLGMLFLLAGYEVKTSELVGREGRRAFYTWLLPGDCLRRHVRLGCHRPVDRRERSGHRAVLHRARHAAPHPP